MPLSGTTENPCACCGDPLIPVKMSCRTRSGTATLCGFSEYSDFVTHLPAPSVPPRKFRTQTLGQVAPGGYGKCTKYVPDCTGLSPTQYWKSLSGTYKFSATDCAETNTQFITTLLYSGADSVCVSQGAVYPPETGALNHQVGVPPSWGVVEMNLPDATLFFTQTTLLFDGNNHCSASSVLETGNVILLLSDQDGESDAIARNTASWSGWTETGNGTGVPPTCFPWECCLATIELRTTGFSFLFQSAQYRIVNYALSLNTNTNYTIKVLIYRRVRGSGSPFVLYQTLEFPITTDAFGNFPAFDGDVPNDPGYDTYSGSAYAQRVP